MATTLKEERKRFHWKILFYGHKFCLGGELHGTFHRRLPSALSTHNDRYTTRSARMALVAYGSSDEDEEEGVQDVPSTQNNGTKDADTVSNGQGHTDTAPSHNGMDTHRPQPTASITSIEPLNQTKEVEGSVGASIGPTMPAEMLINDTPSPVNETTNNEAPLSPYSLNRATIRQLTMPSVPNLNLPPAPDGIAPEKTNTKFAHFLKLKRQGVHFNEKLASTPALKNPNLFEKLMDFAGITEDDVVQTTLNEQFTFPSWAYKEELAKVQKEIEKDNKASRKTLDFVPASSTNENHVNTSTNGQQSTAERVMAGLNDGKTAATSVQAGIKRKSRFDN